MVKSLHTLLERSIDYAGLFPPAHLAMDQAISNYATYAASADQWLLGRFVLPCARLAEWETAAHDLLPRRLPPWRLSVIASDDLRHDLQCIREFNTRHALPHMSAAVIDTIELRAHDAATIQAALHAIAGELDAFVELPLTPNPHDLITMLALLGGRAKVRTGGTTPDQIPTSNDLLCFLAACTTACVPFKATAGLHQPLRTIHRLTYAPDSAVAPMFGFLNVFVATACLRAGVATAEVAAVLEETSPDAFEWNDAGVRWRDHWLDRAALAATRHNALIAFGSCSFDEPLEGLKAMGWL